MRTAQPIHDDYIRAALHNVVQTTRSAQPLQMPPRLRKRSTFAQICTKCTFITCAVALVLYVAARM